MLLDDYIDKFSYKNGELLEMYLNYSIKQKTTIIITNLNNEIIKKFPGFLMQTKITR